MRTIRDQSWYAVAFTMAVISIWLFVGESGPLQADEIADSQVSPTFNPQTETYDAEVRSIGVSPSTVYPGDTATISATFTNQVQSSSGEGTFDVVFAFEKPDGLTDYRILEDQRFGRNQSRVLSATYPFSQSGRHTIKAEIYNPDRSHRFDQTSTSFTVRNETYDAEVRSIGVSPSTVYPGDTATISATFTNQVQSSSGEGTFDVVFAFEKPDGLTDYRILEDQRFGRNQSRVLSATYPFSQSGRHTIKAEIYNPDRSHRFDQTSTSFTVRNETYDAEVRSIGVSPSTVYPGDTATISATFTNQVQSSSGEGTFDVVFAFEKPDGLTDYRILEDQRFGRNQSRVLSATYPFSQSGRHTIKAEIYNPDRSHRFDQTSTSFTVRNETYDAEVRSIGVSPSTVYPGDTATISATFTNQVQSSSGEGTFDVVFAFEKPDGLTDYRILEDQRFGRNQSRVLSATYPFSQSGRHTIKAEIYNPDRSHRFDQTSTSFTVRNETYDAEVRSIGVSPSTVYPGDTATISATFTNQVQSSSGEGTFDVVFAFEKPDGLTDYRILEDQRFGRNQSRVLSATYPFSQSGRHTIKAEIYNPDRSHRFDQTSTSFTVEAVSLPDLAIEIAEQVTPVVGKPLTVPVTVRNNGGSPSGPFNVNVVIGRFEKVPNDDEMLRAIIEATAYLEYQGLNAGQSLIRRLNSETITENLDPGGSYLCVQIEYVNTTDDSNQSDNTSCKLIYVLPDMGEEFPGGLQAYFHRDDEFQLSLNIDIDIREIIQGSTATSFAGLGPVLGALGAVLVGSTQESSLDYGSQSFWVFVPAKYSAGESEELAKEIVERTTGGLEHREDRIERYEKLSLEIARRGQTYGNKFYSVGETEKEKQEFLDTVAKVYESREGVVEVGGRVINVSEFLIDMAEVTGVEIDLSDIDIFHGHLNHLTADKVGGFLAGVSAVAKTAGLVSDIRITESLNRTIHYGQAMKTLAVLEELALEDAAWQEAVQRAKSELDDMTSPDGYERWSSALEKNLPKIVGVYADLALKFAVKKAAVALAAKAIGSIGILAGAPVAVVAIPLTIVSVLTIEELYELANETAKFWDGVTLAGMSTQVYSHVHRRLLESGLDESDRQALEEIRDYLKFAYYKHLARAAESDPEFASINVGIWGDGKISHDILTSERGAIFHERDDILSKAFGGLWDHTKDFKFLDDAVNPSDIWSDDETMWIVTGQTPHSHQIYRFSLEDQTELEGMDLRFLRPSHGSIHSPRGIWFDGSYVWILNTYFQSVLGKYNVNDPVSYSLSNLRFLYGDDISPKLSGGIWSDGTTTWLTSREDCAIIGFNNIDQYTDRPNFGIDIADRDKEICELADDNAHPYGLWSDGKTMWVSDRDEGRIFAYSVRSGEQEPGVPGWGEREIDKEIVTVKVVDVSEETYPHIANNSTPTGIWSDGETMWVADYESDRIFAYTLPDSLSPPLNLAATVSGSGGDSQVDLSWQAPSDTGKSTITGYVVQESGDDQTWKQLVAHTGSSSTTYSDGRSMEWSVRYYRVAAINSSGVGPYSSIVTVYRTFGIASIGCSPTRFYAGDPVECAPTIVGDSTAEFTYAWRAHDGAVTWDVADSSTASVTWDSPGAKQLRVVACRIGNPTEYINTTLSDVGPADIDVGQASGGACAEATQTVRVADPTPRLAPGWRLPDDPIALGESVDLEFSITRTHWVGGPGGITVSFPDLTLANSGDGSAPYESSQGKVTTVSYSGNNSRIDYYDSGITGTVEDTDGNDIQPSYLIVATDNDQWPPPIVPPERRLRLRVTPKEAGEFRILYRYWLCNEERQDGQGNPYCHQYPGPGDSGNGTLDQQGWAVREFTVTVVAPPVIESVGCGPGTVDVNNAVACTPSLSGGSPDEYTWTAGNVVAGGNPPSGSDATFSTSWSFSGRQTVSLRVCNDVSGCVSEKQTITVNAEPTDPTVVVVPEMDEEEEEPEPSDGGRVLISGLASDWAHSSYSPTDTTIQVRALPTPDMPTLEITLYDEDGFAAGAGDYVSPGALVLALPDDVWVDYGGISVEINILGSWVEYSGEFEESLLALETLSGGEQRIVATALRRLAPAVGTAPGPALTAADHLALGLGGVGQPPVDEIFQGSFANCVSQVTVPWLALALQTKGVRISIPADISTDDYVSLAVAAITAEGEDGEEAALLQVHDILDTGDAAPGCGAP